MENTTTITTETTKVQDILEQIKSIFGRLEYKIIRQWNDTNYINLDIKSDFISGTIIRLVSEKYQWEFVGITAQEKGIVTFTFKVL